MWSSVREISRVFRYRLLIEAYKLQRRNLARSLGLITSALRRQQREKFYEHNNKSTGKVEIYMIADESRLSGRVRSQNSNTSSSTEKTIPSPLAFAAAFLTESINDRGPHACATAFNPGRVRLTSINHPIMSGRP